MTNGLSFFRKNIPHTLFERVAKGLCVSGRLKQNCNILTPRFSGYSSTSFSFSWAAQPGASRAQLSAGSGSHCLELQQLTLKLTELSVRTGLYHLFDVNLLPVSVASAPNSTRPQSILYPDIFDRMHLFLHRRLGQMPVCCKVGRS